MRGLWRGWYAVSCLLALVFAHPLNQKEKALLRAKLSSLETLDVEDIPEDTFEELIEDYDSHRPIAAPKKNRLVVKPLALEPDAEMLPVHYKGVKSPGVDHMEMIFVDPDMLDSHHLGKTANQASKIEEDGDIPEKKKSIKGKEAHSKRFKHDQIENSQKSKKRDPQRNERNWYAGERKRNNRFEKEEIEREGNYGGIGNSARTISDEEFNESQN